MPINDPLLSYPLKVACEAASRAESDRQRAARCRTLYERATALRAHSDPEVATLARLACSLAAEVGGQAAENAAREMQTASLAASLLTHAERLEGRLQRLERRGLWQWLSEWVAQAGHKRA